MKKIIALIFCICAIGAAVFAVRYVNAPVNSIPVELTTHEESISAKGFIVRDEKVYYARNTGTIYNHAIEGERVSKDSIISTVYSGVISGDTIKELGTIDRKITKAESLQYKASFKSSDSSSVENDISFYTNSIFAAARDKNVEQVAEYKDYINGLRKNGEIGYEDQISSLEAQKKAIEDRIGTNKDEIFTEISGIFTTYLDGLESVLNPERINDYTVSYIENLMGERDTYGNVSGSVKTGDPICKVVNNHLWYVILTVDADKLNDYKKGTNVKLRFKNISDAESTGTISYVSEPQTDNKAVVMIKCPEYMESAFAYRDADVDVILRSYTGYKVPVQAIRTNDGKYSVVAAAGNKQFSCECEILYSDTEENAAIIRSTETAQNKISKMDTIIVGER